MYTNAKACTQLGCNSLTEFTFKRFFSIYKIFFRPEKWKNGIKRELNYWIEASQYADLSSFETFLVTCSDIFVLHLNIFYLVIFLTLVSLQTTDMPDFHRINNAANLCR